MLLAIPAAQADRIEPHGTLHDLAHPPPPTEELVRLALCNRPDLAAYRLGVWSATANVELQRRERFPDVFAASIPLTPSRPTTMSTPTEAPRPGGRASSPPCRSPTAIRATSAEPMRT